jgi:hypothetical protein
MRRSAGTDAPWFIRLLRRAEKLLWEHWATDAEYRCRFGSCMHHRDASMAEQGEALFVVWLFIVLQWLAYTRITGQ